MAERDRLVNGKGFTHLDTDGSVKIDAYKVVNYRFYCNLLSPLVLIAEKIYGVTAHCIYHHKPVIPRPQHF